MKQTHFSLKLILLLAGILLLALPSCSKLRKSAAAETNVDYYTCTMHPSVRSKEPGNCPICSMTLVPVMKKGAEISSPHQHNSPKPATGERGHDHARMLAEQAAGKHPAEVANTDFSEFSVPVERQQQIGVTYAKVERKPLHHSIHAENASMRLIDNRY